MLTQKLLYSRFPITRLGFVLLCSFFLFLHLSNHEKLGLQPDIKRQRQLLPSFLEKKKKSLTQCFPKKQMALKELFMAFILGETEKIPLPMRREFKILNLQHIYTPSGQHLSSLLLIFSPLVFLFKKGKRWKEILTLGLCVALFFLPRFYALKRMALWKILSIGGRYYLLQKFDPDLRNFLIFLLTFLLDFCVGTYSSSPLSFAYGFLFLGIIISLYPRPRLALPFYLLGGQVLCSYFYPTPLSRTGIFFNFFISGLFDLIYPLLFLGFWIEWCPLIFHLLQFLQKVIHHSAQWAESSGHFESSLPLVLFFFISTMRFSYQTWLGKFILVLCLLIHSENLYNTLVRRSDPYSLMKKIILPLPKAEEFLRGRFDERGYLLLFEDKTCHLLFRNDKLVDRCRFKSNK